MEATVSFSESEGEGSGYEERAAGEKRKRLAHRVALEIRNLPPEMLAEILSHLSASDLAKAARVCRLWSEKALKALGERRMRFRKSAEIGSISMWAKPAVFDGRFVVAKRDGRVLVVDADASGPALVPLSRENANPYVYGLLALDDTLVVVTDDGAVRLFDRRLEVVGTFAGPAGPFVTLAAWGSLLAVSYVSRVGSRTVTLDGSARLVGEFDSEGWTVRRMTGWGDKLVASCTGGVPARGSAVISWDAEARMTVVIEYGWNISPKIATWNGRLVAGNADGGARAWNPDGTLWKRLGVSAPVEALSASGDKLVVGYLRSPPIVFGRDGTEIATLHFPLSSAVGFVSFERHTLQDIEMSSDFCAATYDDGWVCVWGPSWDLAWRKDFWNGRPTDLLLNGDSMMITLHRDDEVQVWTRF